MKTETVIAMLSEAGVAFDRPTPFEPVVPRVEKVLEELGVAAEQVRKMAVSTSYRDELSPAAAGVGSGFAAWNFLQSRRLIDQGIEVGGEVGEFLVRNAETMTKGWDAMAEPLSEALIEFTLRLPNGTIDVGKRIAHLLEHQEELKMAFELTFEHGVRIIEALEWVDLGGDAWDVVEGAATLGVGIVVGWAGAKWVESRYAPEIAAREERLAELESEHSEILKLRYLLTTELPACASPVNWTGSVLTTGFFEAQAQGRSRCRLQNLSYGWLRPKLDYALSTMPSKKLNRSARGPCSMICQESSDSSRRKN